MPKHKPRMTPDRWLYLLHQNLRPYFRDNGYPLPTNLEFRCGFPRGRNADGEIWHGDRKLKDRKLRKLAVVKEQKDDTNPHCVFVSPLLDDPMEVAETVVHELIHAALPPDAKHKYEFQQACRVLGLVMTLKNGRTEIDDDPKRFRWHNHPRRGARTQADNDPPMLSPVGVALRRLLEGITARLGAYPHKALMRRPRPGEGTTGGDGDEGAVKTSKTHHFRCAECKWRVRIGPASLAMGPPMCGNYECENYGGECEEREPKSAAT